MNSHTIQRAYLRGFVLDESTDCKFDVFSKKTKRWRRLSPKSTTVRPDYYAVQRRDGTIDNSLEDELNRLIETPGIAALRKLLRGGPLFSNEKRSLALYIGCTMTRTTKTQDLQSAADRELSDPEFVKTYIQQNRQRLDSLRGKAEVDEFLEKLDKDGSSIRLHPSWYLQSLRSADRFGDIICGMNWMIETTTGPEWFVTSDHPAFVCRPTKPYLPYTVGLTRDDLGAELCFPLSKSCFLRATFCELRNERQKASIMRVHELNRRVAIHATDEVVAPHKSGWAEIIIEEEADRIVRPIDPKWAVTAG